MKTCRKEKMVFQYSAFSLCHHFVMAQPFCQVRTWLCGLPPMGDTQGPCVLFAAGEHLVCVNVRSAGSLPCLGQEHLPWRVG